MRKKRLIIISVVSVLIIAILGGIIAVTAITANTHLDKDKLNTAHSSITLLDNNNNTVEYGRNTVKIEEVSPFLKDAFVALEDKRFYEHNGIDYRRIVGASIKNLKSMSYKEGASTITQQLIKNTHLTNEKKISRKLKEAKLALKLEKEYTKDEILGMYMGVIYFGSGIYGVEDAAESFFGKKAKDLSLSESAVIAGVVKNPKAYSPLINYEGATKRRNVVLGVMKNNQFISEELYNKAINSDIIMNKGVNDNKILQSYMTNVYYEASELLGISEKELIGRGYTIHTYLDYEAQKQLSEKCKAKAYDFNDNKVAIIADNHSKGVKAYYSDQKIPAVNYKRQAGSVLKPFAVYAPALEIMHLSPLNQVKDEPINIGGYSPTNYNGTYHGYVSIRESIANSYNVPAVKLLSEVGIDAGVDFLNRIGINVSQVNKNLSLALGSESVSPIEIASAYSTLANYGEYAPLRFIKSISDSKGKTVYSHSDNAIRVMSEENAFILTDMLRTCAQSGTGKKLKYINADIACKTGTVAAKNIGNTDAWCAAYTPDETYVTLFSAKDNNTPIANNVTGGSYPSMLLASLIRERCSTTPVQKRFIAPNGVNMLQIDLDKLSTTQEIHLASRSTTSVITDYFTDYNRPIANVENDFYGLRTQENNDRVILSLYTTQGKHYKLCKKGFFGRYRVISEFVGDGDEVRIEIDKKLFDSSILRLYCESDYTDLKD